MINAIIRIGLLILIGLFAVGLIHRHFIIEMDLEHLMPLLMPYYAMNGLMGIVTGVVIILLSVRKSTITGFAFMGGSLIKFALFFILFYVDLSANEVVRKQEFITFFIPYAFSVILEVWFLIRHLNKSD